MNVGTTKTNGTTGKQEGKKLLDRRRVRGQQSRTYQNHRGEEDVESPRISASLPWSQPMQDMLLPSTSLLSNVFIGKRYKNPIIDPEPPRRNQKGVPNFLYNPLIKLEPS